MWICRNCETENDKNFRFCWSCGNNRAKIEVIPEPPPKPSVKPLEKSAPTPKPIERIPEVTEKSETENKFNETAAKTRVEPRPKSHPQNFDDDVMPMFSRVIGAEKPASADDVSIERKVFTIAVRLVGLFLLYQVFVALPDLIALIKNSGGINNEFSDVLTGALVFPILKIAFYFIVGIYLIASGKILLWLLPD